MLMAIKVTGRVASCSLRQAYTVHFETTVTKVVALNKAMVFYDRNATLVYRVAIPT